MGDEQRVTRGRRDRGGDERGWIGWEEDRYQIKGVEGYDERGDERKVSRRWLSDSRATVGGEHAEAHRICVGEGVRVGMVEAHKCAREGANESAGASLFLSLLTCLHASAAISKAPNTIAW